MKTNKDRLFQKFIQPFVKTINRLLVVDRNTWLNENNKLLLFGGMNQWRHNMWGLKGFRLGTAFHAQENFVTKNSIYM